MHYIKVSYKKYSKLYNILLFIVTISLTLGLIISSSLDSDLLNNIYNYFINHINNYNNNMLGNILYPVLSYFIIFITSLTFIGSILSIFLLSIENISMGLIIGILLKKHALKGVLFALIYFILTKGIYLLILIYLIINIYKFIKSILISLKDKNNTSIYSLYSKIILKFIFSIIVITLYNLICIFLVPKLISIFIFLI